MKNEASKKECKVCEKAESRYKCPMCLIPYCSLVCFKKHKEIPCVKPVPASENDTSTSITTVDVDRPCYVNADDEVLQRSQLERIASNTEIIDALKDKELQKLIHKIDSSADAETELDKAMDDEAFRLFTEKILSTLNQSGDQQL
ncbi:putative Zinc finger HIT domain-containing protein [Helianthus annuus]|uniref:Zinc finger HIT domain-containing protein n=1 Tax=Helianthus annuus TaxID=4232 RepID=A0A9K3HUF1_HELAN|nr:zinc finger HIT domain-containing protein 3-like [Helianthus annuus]KAF5784812.1 putative Zinc finger HIT domain-containing protein [Helianthus annuus]KAJ0519993.1 putative Zinc finger HIT domain-containing protein [Helianthus annuus]KAJ0528585.1 putative Zinc finger HIT domain-containing protein [Helianthus annuus]KAJ0698972.1 putative Zinc finger HIT domain-containing protein [Helianthus annuus]KAJ0882218.1 putative Zinc finger HIT domain-containing protein [Helianthus annuus]